MMDESPENCVLGYATPWERQGLAPAFRSGRFLVMQRRAELPCRCVICNGPGEEPAVELAISAEVSFRFQLFGGIKFPRLNDRADLRFYYCAWHLALRRRAQGVCAILVSFGLAMAATVAIGPRLSFNGMSPNLYSGLAFCAIALLFGAGVARVVATRGPYFSRRKGNDIYIRGMGNRFLESLQEFAPIGEAPGEST